MRIPRDVSGSDLVGLLAQFGYVQTRQRGSHVRLSRKDEAGTHHITIPLNDPLRIGTLNSILTDIARHIELDKQDLIERLFS